MVRAYTYLIDWCRPSSLSPPTPLRIPHMHMHMRRASVRELCPRLHAFEVAHQTLCLPLPGAALYRAADGTVQQELVDSALETLLNELACHGLSNRELCTIPTSTATVTTATATADEVDAAAVGAAFAQVGTGCSDGPVRVIAIAAEEAVLCSVPLGGVATAAVATPAVATPAVATAAVATPAVATPAVATPAVTTPAVATPAVATAAGEAPLPAVRKRPRDDAASADAVTVSADAPTHGTATATAGARAIGTGGTTTTAVAAATANLPDMPERSATAASPDADLHVAFEDVGTRLRETLLREGVAIVTGCLLPEDLSELQDAFGRDLLEIVDVDAARACADARVGAALDRFLREGPARFPHRTVSAGLAPGGAGFMLQRCMSHGRMAWRVRTHPRVHAAFAALYPNEAGPLVSSLDATFFTPRGTPPWHHDRADANPRSAHVDQNAHDLRPGGLGQSETYQGVLYLWAAGDGCTTTAAWPRSHTTIWPKMMEAPVAQAYGRAGVHYCEISSLGGRLEAELMAGWQRHGRRLHVPAGALLLWSSRTVHTGWRGAGPRLAQAVCLEPRSQRSESQRVAKMRLAALGLPSTHWARVGHQHDMVPDDIGFVSDEQSSTAPQGAQALDEVLLPLRRALRPWGLAEAANLTALRALAQVDWIAAPGGTGEVFTGMWDPPEGSEEVLAPNLREEAKCVL